MHRLISDIILFLLLAAPAFAASPPAITVPAGQIVVPGATAITGISIAETGAGPTTQFTTTLTASGTLTATGAQVTGSGTSSLSIAGTSAQTNTALTTLAINETCVVPAQCTDIITVNLHDAGNNVAPQQQIPIVADGNRYLTFATLALAQTRSAAQCTSLSCDGIKTTYWWSVLPTATGAAVQIWSGNACFDATVGPNATSPCAIARLHAGTGLTSGEQSSLVTAPNAGFAVPTISGGAVTP